MKPLIRYTIDSFLFAANRPVFGEKLIAQRQAAYSACLYYELQLLMIDQEKRKENAGTD